MKLKKSTVAIMITSWILFFAICIFSFIQLSNQKEAMTTKDKIFKSKTTKTTTTTTETEEETLSDEERLKEFMTTYYRYLVKGDEEKLSLLVEDPDELKSSRLVERLQRYVIAYKNLSFHIDDGMDEDSYIVYATYDTQIKDIDTLAPSMNRYYVVKKEDTFLLYNNEKHYTKSIRNRMKLSLQSESIKEIVNTTDEAYDHALKKSKELREFFDDSES